MGEVIDSASVLGTKSELELFTVPPTQVAIQNSYWHEVYAKNCVTNTGPYQFVVAPDPNYLDLSCNFMHIRLKVLQHDNSSFADGAEVSPINAIGKTFFKQVKVWLNSRLCYDSGDTYAYRAYLETLLNYGSDAKSTHLQTCLYSKDTAGSMDANTNAGHIARRTMSKMGAVMDLIAPIHADVFQQDRLILNNTEVRLDLHRNSDNFCLFSLTDGHARCKIVVESMVWYIKKVEVLKSLALGVEATLTRNPAMYPIRRVAVKTMLVEEGRFDVPHNLLFNGQLPRRIIIGCVDKDAYHGNLKKNPFNFKPFDISNVQIRAGDLSYPRNAIKCDFPNNSYAHAYASLMDATGVSRADRGIDISYKDFKSGYCLFGFSLNPDASDGDTWDLIRSGTSTVKMTFSAATPADGLHLIILAEWDNLMRLDRSRNPFFDFSV